MTTEERLAKLERENRWMKLGGAVLLLALVAVVFVGAGQEEDKPKVLEEVRAKKFVAVDQSGRPYMVLGDFSGIGFGRPDDGLLRGIAMQGEGPMKRIWICPDSRGGGPTALFASSKSSYHLLVNAEASSVLLRTVNDHSVGLWAGDCPRVTVSKMYPTTLTKFVSLLGPNPDPGRGLFFGEYKMFSRGVGWKEENLVAGVKLGENGKVVLFNPD